MTIALALTTAMFDERVRVELEQLPETKVFLWRNAFRIVQGDITIDSSDAVLETLENLTVPIEAFNFDLRGHQGRWNRIDPTWVAFELLGDELLFLDKGNSFNPSLPEPCLGMVAKEEPIRIAEKPRGHACCAKEDTIFSKRMCDFLTQYGSATFGEVVYRGETLEKWYRLFCDEREPTIAEEGLQMINCSICGTSGRSPIGILLGRHSTLGFCQNSFGISHGNIDHPYILSTKVATELTRKIRAGYGLQPIIDVECAAGQKAVQLLERIKRLPRMKS